MQALAVLALLCLPAALGDMQGFAYHFEDTLLEESGTGWDGPGDFGRYDDGACGRALRVAAGEATTLASRASGLVGRAGPWVLSVRLKVLVAGARAAFVAWGGECDGSEERERGRGVALGMAALPDGTWHLQVALLGGSTHAAKQDLVTGRWYRIVVVCDGSTRLRLYIDPGDLAAAEPALDAPLSGALGIEDKFITLGGVQWSEGCPAAMQSVQGEFEIDELRLSATDAAASAVADTGCSSWVPFVRLDRTAGHVMLDRGEAAFNAAFAACPVVRYRRNGATHSIYIRTTSFPEGASAYDLFTHTWASAGNRLNVDFELYSSLGTRNRQGVAARWQRCNYDDGGVGYPRDCGKEGLVISQWFKWPRNGRVRMPGITAGVGFDIFDAAVGGACPSNKAVPPSMPVPPTPQPEPSPAAAFVKIEMSVADGATIAATGGEVTDGYLTYPPHVNLRLTVAAPGACTLTWQFLDTDHDGFGKPCTRDYVAIESAAGAVIDGPYCGSWLPVPSSVRLPGAGFSVVFVSDGAGERPGFDFTFACETKPTSTAPPLPAPPSPAPLTPAPPTPAPSTSVPATPRPPTPRPPTPAPSTRSPPSPAPATLIPPTAAPPTSAPPTPAPPTPAPLTSVPSTLVPTTPAPLTAIPFTVVPPTSVPATPTPPTPSPTTASPPSPASVTLASLTFTVAGDACPVPRRDDVVLRIAATAGGVVLDPAQDDVGLVLAEEGCSGDVEARCAALAACGGLRPSGTDGVVDVVVPVGTSRLSGGVDYSVCYKAARHGSEWVRVGQKVFTPCAPPNWDTSSEGWTEWYVGGNSVLPSKSVVLGTAGPGGAARGTVRYPQHPASLRPVKIEVAFDGLRAASGGDGDGEGRTAAVLEAPQHLSVAVGSCVPPQAVPEGTASVLRFDWARKHVDVYGSDGVVAFGAPVECGDVDQIALTGVGVVSHFALLDAVHELEMYPASGCAAGAVGVVFYPPTEDVVLSSADRIALLPPAAGGCGAVEEDCLLCPGQHQLEVSGGRARATLPTDGLDGRTAYHTCYYVADRATWVHLAPGGRAAGLTPPFPFMCTPPPVDECTAECSTCANRTCTAVGQVCADTNPSSPGNWECRCPPGTEGRASRGVAAQCVAHVFDAAQRSRLEKGGAAAAVLGAFSGAGAVSAGKLAVARTLRCDISDVGVSIGGEEPLAFEFHPLGVPVGPRAVRYLVGAALLNWVFIVGVLLAALLAAAVIRGAYGTRWLDSRGVARVPSIAYLPFLFVLQGTSLAASRLLFVPSAGAGFVAIGAAVLAAICLIIAFIWTRIIRRLPDHAAVVFDERLGSVGSSEPYECDAADGGDGERRIEPFTGVTRTAYHFVFGPVIWVTSGGDCFVERYGVVIDAFRPGMEWLVVPELVAVLAVSALAMTVPSARWVCDARNFLLCLILFALFVLVSYYRPFNAPMENLVAAALAGLVFLSVFLLCIAVATDAGPGSGWSAWAAWMTLVTTYVVLAKAVFDIAVYCLDLWLERKSGARAAHRKRQEKERARQAASEPAASPPERTLARAVLSAALRPRREDLYTDPGSEPGTPQSRAGSVFSDAGDWRGANPLPPRMQDCAPPPSPRETLPVVVPPKPSPQLSRI